VTEPLVVVGAGGFGREALDVAEARNAVEPTWNILGVVDDAPSSLNLERLHARGVRFLGSVGEIPAGATVVIGVGGPGPRSEIASRLAAADYAFAVLRHPSAVVGTQVEIGAGTVICAGVSVGTNVTLGWHVHLNPHSVIGHDTRIEDAVSVNPNATVSGDCVVGEGTLVGAGAVVLQGLHIGARAVVAASACVVRDVQDGSTVMGVPAR
jgi:sugar O-acyltransferase (sialic acid O-acetyltransferase NeuD family)